MAASVKKSKVKLREVNRHLVCRLCRGYYVDATTIVECLHSFCRSCIIKYLEKNSFCPICEVQIHKTKPYLNLRLDKALQDVVYKLVPGLYHAEMKRRREFYAKNPQYICQATPEDQGLEDRLIFSPDDSISLSLEYLERYDQEGESSSSACSESGGDSQGHQDTSFPQQLGLMMIRKSRESQESDSSKSIPDVPTILPKRYLQCPAVVNISHLKKFIRIKYELTEKWEIDIIHKRVSLPDHYTLMDIAYIYTWKKSAPIRFFYQINKKSPFVSASLSKVNNQPQIPKETEVKIKETEEKPSNNVVETKKETRKPPVVKASDPVAQKEKKPVEESPKKDDKLIINPFSGKLESPSTPLPGTERVPDETPKIKSTNSVKTNGSVEKRETPKEKVKNTSVNLLKSFRKEKSQKEQIKSSNALTITTTTPAKKEKLPEKYEAHVSIEIKSEKGCEYDFDSVSPPARIMSLQEYTKSELYKNKYTKTPAMSLQDFRPQVEEKKQQEKNKSPVPSLYRIGESKKPNENERKLTNEASKIVGNPSPLKVPSKIEEKLVNTAVAEKAAVKREAKEDEKKISPKIPKLEPNSEEKKEILKHLLKRKESPNKEEVCKKQKLEKDVKVTPKKEKKAGDCIAMDLSKADLKEKHPLDNLIEFANKGAESKAQHQNMLELLISVAQKQSIEPLLKIPQPNRTQPDGTSTSQAKSQVTPTAITQALQFFQKLSSDMKSMEAKAQNNAEQKLQPKPPNVVSLQQFYQQQIELIRFMKRQQQQINSKNEKRSPTELNMNKPEMYFDDKTKQTLSPKLDEQKKSPENTQLKTSVERTLSQIQEQAEIQSRLLAAQNYKNLPALLQYYQSQAICRQTKPKQKSPNSKQGQSQPNEQHLNSPNYFFNTGLSSEMSFHQMFQQYLDQQLKINQRKVLTPKLLPKITPPKPSTTTSETSPAQTAKKPADLTVVPLPKS